LIDDGIKNTLSLYIHIPFCFSKCSYCDFFSIEKKELSVSQVYIDALCNELTFRLEEYKKEKGAFLINTIYIGGGTPSLLSSKQLKQIWLLINNYPLHKELEFTFEVNPDDVTKELLQALEGCGVNRISCGLQSFSDTVLKSVHRRAGREEVLKALQLLSENWHGIVSADLICGLPGESLSSLLEGLKKLTSIKTMRTKKLPHISFYSLCVEEETPLGRAIKSGYLKYNQDYSDELWLQGRDFLLQQGYEQYEISNFAQAGYECRHNMTYWTHKDYIGCGCGAVSTIRNRDGSSLRIENKKNIELYTGFWLKNALADKEKLPQNIEKIDFNTSQFEYFMMGLRTSRGIYEREYEEIFGQKLPEKIKEIFKNWQKKADLKLLEDEKGGKIYSLTANGMLFLNRLLEEINMEL